MPSPYTGRVIYRCPIDGAALDEDDGSLRCPEDGQAFSAAEIEATP